VAYSVLGARRELVDYQWKFVLLDDNLDLPG
jgi:hypothetical protein